METQQIVPSLLAAFALVTVHTFAGKLRFLQGTPRSRWLSAAGGISVSYVFLHLLPELAERQEVLNLAAGEAMVFLTHHAYLLALLGLFCFYGLENAVKVASRRKQHEQDKQETWVAGIFWLHMLFYSIYNGLIGYLLLHRISEGVSSLLTYSIAMALHFLVTDYGLQENHRQLYERLGRWILTAAIAGGWIIGLIVDVHRLALVIPMGFLAGGVILNVLKEELPEERQSRFSAFLIGGVCYSAFLLAI